MPKFNYVAMDAKGKEVTGLLETDNTTSAVTRIREMGYFPTQITEVNQAQAAAAAKAPAKPAPGAPPPPAPPPPGKAPKKGFGLGSLKPSASSESQSAQVSASGGSRGLGRDRNAKGGSNPAIVRAAVTDAEVAAFKKGIA